ncbi:hypothetical protein SAMN02745225_01022 [Ferrithrix thermotolerans DSM 19514]|uniref:Uncharacterized protein n=1 Tax=Ferrithrix thermotolerans DSM 19514 TaxID=1121881 RepID=A0A1M4ULX7_9ACTN|nr:hypothetical protein [Ferrithrix thermotolerans]SHE57658.1 hypothetical protein SAMN02745225_01022 [Ferrithrix thermotolerans DSM 19514]
MKEESVTPSQTVLPGSETEIAVVGALKAPENKDSSHLAKVRTWAKRSSSTNPALDLLKTAVVLFFALFVGTTAAKSLKLTLFGSKVTHVPVSVVIERIGVGTRTEVERIRENEAYQHQHRSKMVQVPSTLPVTGLSTTSTTAVTSGSTYVSGSSTSASSSTTTVSTTTSVTSTTEKVIPPKSPKEPKPAKVIPPKSPKEPKPAKVIPPKSPKQ